MTRGGGNTNVSCVFGHDFLVARSYDCRRAESEDNGCDGRKIDPQRRGHTLADSTLPPSMFGAGFTSGSAAQAPSPYDVPASTVSLQETGLNRLAVISFVGALILGLIAAPVTLPMSMYAHRRIRQSGGGGARLAFAAMVISAVYLVIGVVVVLLYVFVTGL